MDTARFEQGLWGHFELQLALPWDTKNPWLNLQGPDALVGSPEGEETGTGFEGSQRVGPPGACVTGQTGGIGAVRPRTLKRTGRLRPRSDI